MLVKVKRLYEGMKMPRYAHEGDSGFDLVAMEDVVVAPGETAKVPTGLAFEIPEGYELQIRPRSGITSKTKLRVQFGTVDSNYRGEVGVTVDNVKSAPFQLAFDFDTLENLGLDDDGESVFVENIEGTSEFNPQEGSVPDGTYIIRKGDRIAQGVIAPVVRVRFMPAKELSDTTRGTDGFGSTGAVSN